MPKPTFLKLANAKRKSFLHEAYKEFAIHSFEAASITNLVKSLGIAKGSVYQYFDDKEDLYNFLITDADRQLILLTEKACVYNGEHFYDWYTKLLMVEVKFLLSFPQYALLFQKLTAQSSPNQKRLAKSIEEQKLSRISAQLPASLYDSEINQLLLVRTPSIIFEMLTKDIDLHSLIQEDSPVYLDSKAIVSLCSTWVEKLKNGL
jgi:AcrR family transcriptional regulator